MNGVARAAARAGGPAARAGGPALVRAVLRRPRLAAARSAGARGAGSQRALCAAASRAAPASESEGEAGEGGAVTAAYEERVAAGAIRDDPAQRYALLNLDRLYGDILEFDKERPRRLAAYQEARRSELSAKKEEANRAAGGGGWLSSLFGLGAGGGPAAAGGPAPARKARAHVAGAPRGVYVHGGPGSGKTFSMELFYHALPVRGKRRVHFNEFMLQVHRMLHSLEKQGYRSDEMMERCAEALYNEGWVLCFDEFQVTDIADAMVIKRLFDSLLARGVALVITSNRAPDELYKNGIQRNLFVPFIEDIKRDMDVVTLQSDVDYRMLTLEKMAQWGAARRKETVSEGGTAADAAVAAVAAGEEELATDSVYFVGAPGRGLGEAAMFERLWDKLTKKQVVRKSFLKVQGRAIEVPEAAKGDDVARFTFNDLCGKPLGAADYYAIASTFHTVFVDRVPRMRLNAVNQMRRFITMVDVLYDQKVVLVLGAAAPMDELLDHSSGLPAEPSADKSAGASTADSRANVDEVFAFERCLSRLHEMNRADYLLHSRTESRRRAEQLGGQSPVRFLSQFELGALGAERQDAQGLSQADVDKLWQRYDRNRDGAIDASELKAMLEEITLFKAGHRHVPEEVLAATREALSGPNDAPICRDKFGRYFTRFGLQARAPAPVNE